VNVLVDDYITIWNEAGPTAGEALLARVWTDDADCLDPLLAGAAVEQIDALVARAQYPGTRFVLAEPPDAHHDVVRFTWYLVPAGGGAVSRGGRHDASMPVPATRRPPPASVRSGPDGRRSRR
jgi:hypothetical protein